MKNIKDFLSNLPHLPGVYQMLNDTSDVLYVGKAKDLKKRLSSYFRKNHPDPKTHALVEQIHDIHITITHHENEAVLLECNLIKKHAPRYNVLLRDDKSYPYITITNQHSYPRIDIYRGQRKKNALYFGPYPHAGAVRETINILQKIFRIRTCRDAYFAARTRPCLLYQIERCTGPCVALISKEHYAQSVELAILFLQGKSEIVLENLQQKMEAASQQQDYEQAAQFRDQMARLRQMQDKQYVAVAEGNADALGFALQAGVVCIQLVSIRQGQVIGSRSYFPKVPIHTTTDEIIAAFITQHYFSDASHVDAIPQYVVLKDSLQDASLLEEALSRQAERKVQLLVPTRGEKKKWLSLAMTSAKQSLTAHFISKTNMQDRFDALQQTLDLPTPIKRIECFDISHSMGEATVASCVVFDQTGPVKSSYRRFNIQGVTPGDDIAAMHQALHRRFQRLQKEMAALPEVVFIDGGLPQLHAAEHVMTALGIDEILLVGVAKGVSRKPGYETLFIGKNPPIHLPADSTALHLIQQIRDEAHRFAITGHRARRDKIRTQSSLEEIPGIGAKRRRDLLRYFGGIQGVAHASLDELMKVSGISRALAERIFTALHDTTTTL